MSVGYLLFRHGGQQRAVGDRLIVNLVFWSMKSLPKDKWRVRELLWGGPSCCLWAPFTFVAQGRLEGWPSSSSYLCLVNCLKHKA